MNEQSIRTMVHWLSILLDMHVDSGNWSAARNYWNQLQDWRMRLYELTGYWS